MKTSRKKRGHSLKITVYEFNITVNIFTRRVLAFFTYYSNNLKTQLTHLTECVKKTKWQLILRTEIIAFIDGMGSLTSNVNAM